MIMDLLQRSALLPLSCCSVNLTQEQEIDCELDRDSEWKSDGCNICDYGSSEWRWIMYVVQFLHMTFHSDNLTMVSTSTDYCATFSLPGNGRSAASASPERRHEHRNSSPEYKVNFDRPYFGRGQTEVIVQGRTSALPKTLLENRGLFFSSKVL